MATREEEALQRVASDPRRQFGWGPSALASQEEKEAYQAYQMLPQVQAGALPVSALPESFGGRPTGTSRRAIRMQAAYDEAVNRELDRQRILTQLELAKRAENRLQKAQDLELKKFGMAEDRESRVLNEADMIINSIKGEIAPDGKIISNPIRPEDPQAIERLENLAGLKFGMENKNAQEMWSTLYKDALDFRQAGIEGAQKETEQQRSWLVGQQEEAASFGVDTAKFFKTDQKTGAITNVDQLGLSKAIGEAKRKDLETKKREIAAAKLDEESKTQARSILDEINKTDSEIRRANFDAARTKGSIRDENIAKAEFLRSERDVLVERFNSFVPQKPTEGATQPQQTELSPRDQSALDWANANPDDPRSQRIKQRLGVE